MNPKIKYVRQQHAPVLGLPGNKQQISVSRQDGMNHVPYPARAMFSGTSVVPDF